MSDDQTEFTSLRDVIVKTVIAQNPDAPITVESLSQ
jgi:hypothetical protein